MDVSVQKIYALAEMGYLCLVTDDGKPIRSFGDRIVRFPLPDIRVPIRIVDRASIMLWLAGMDEGSTFPRFSKFIEVELMRIARLPQPQKTEQALRMLLRYRDAETIVKALAKARSGDVAAVQIQKLSARYKRRLMRISGITGITQSD